MARRVLSRRVLSRRVLVRRILTRRILRLRVLRVRGLGRDKIVLLTTEVPPFRAAKQDADEGGDPEEELYDRLGGVWIQFSSPDW